MLIVHVQPHAGRCSLNNMTTITFGFRTDSTEHPFVKRALKLSREFMNCTGPVSNLVDFVPLLQKFPTAIQCRGQELHIGLVETYGGFIKDIQQRMQAGARVENCLAKTLVELKDEENLDDLDMALMASAFLIGVETVSDYEGDWASHN